MIPLERCPNPIHKAKLFGRPVRWQIAKDFWAEEAKDGTRSKHFFSLRYVEAKEGTVALYTLILGKLYVCMGVKKKDV